MIPDQLKQMFGLNSKKDVNMANNIWKMLDQMAESSPDKYKQFIEKNLKQGAQQAKQKKQQKEKPFRIKPQKGFLLEFDVVLKEKYLSVTAQNQTKMGTKLQQKLDLSGAKWQQVRKKFKPKVHVCLNVCYSDRVKIPLDKKKGQLSHFNLNSIRQIEVFYYSLQASRQIKKQKSDSLQLDYCMILNKALFESLMKEGVNGKKILMSLAISYFEQRLQTDHNPLLKLYNPQHYHKLAYYAVQKFTIQFNSDKNFFYNNSSQMPQFLLEKQIDIKRSEQVKQQKNKIAQRPQQKPKQQIKFKEEPKKETLIKKIQQSNQQKNNQLINKTSPQQKNPKIKKPLIQVLNQTQTDEKVNENLPYQMKTTQQGYHIEILIPGINSIEELNLEISDFKIKLKINKTQQKVEIELKNPINSDSAKAKLKKKTQRLVIDVTFLSKV